MQNPNGFVKSGAALVPDRNEAQRFLHALDPDGQFTFQTFDDRPQKDQKLVRVLHGTLAHHWKGLCDLNALGAGIFVTVNQTDLKGRKTENITGIRAVFVDLDGAPVQPVVDAPLKPHIVIESSPGRFHAYWLAEGLPLAEFALIQKALITAFHSDPAVHDLPRVMRLPGFMHRKGDAFRTRTISITSTPRYTTGQIHAAFPVQSQIQTRDTTTRPAGGKVIPAGNRNDSLMRIGVGLRKLDGLDESQLTSKLLEANTQCCQPPLSDNEVRSIAHSVSRYAPNSPMPKDVASSLVRDISSVMQTNPSAAFAPESLAAIAIVHRDAPGEYVAFKRAARGYVKEIEAAMRRQRLHVVSDPHTEEMHAAVDMIPDSPVPDLVIPQPYRLLSDATAVEVQTENGPSVRNIAESPCLITMRLRDEEEGTEHLQLTWRRSEKWESLITDRGTSLNARQLVSLAAQGYPVGSDNAGELAKYHRKLEAANLHRLQTVPSTSHLGWQGGNGDIGFLWGATLLSPDGTAAPVGTLLSGEVPSDAPAIFLNPHDPGDVQVIRGFHSAGDMDVWQQIVSILGKYPNALIPFYAGFVPPLLRVLEHPGFVVDISGRTSVGKSTVLRAAASVWGRPDESRPDAVMSTWDSTRVHIERRAAIQTDLPILLDDTQLQPKKELINDLIYQISSGRGRGRGSVKGIATTSTFNTVLLSSGEAPASSFSEHGGARTRILEVRGLPFGAEGKDTRSVVDRLNTRLRLHYGHAGPAFVSWLLGQKKHWGEFRNICRGYTERFSEDTTGAGIRLASLAGVIATTAELVHLALDLRWDHTVSHAALGQTLGYQTQDLDNDVRALKSAVSWAYSRQESFYGRHERQEYHDIEEPVRPREGWLGAWSIDVDWKFVGIFPHRLDEFMKREGYRPDAILSAWQDRGWLFCEGKHRTRKVWVEKERPRLFCITREAFNGVDE